MRPGETLVVPVGWYVQLEHPFGDGMVMQTVLRSSPVGRPQLPLRDPVQRMALRRNVEKLLAGTSSFHEAADFLLRGQMSEVMGPGLTPKTRDLRRHARALLLQVMQPGEMSSFFQELVHQRFDLPRRPEVMDGKSLEEQRRELKMRGGAAGVRKQVWLTSIWSTGEGSTM